MSVNIRSIFSNAITSKQDTHTHTLLTCQPLRIPSPSAFFLLMGLALHWSLTAESNHLACFMGVIRLDFTFPIWHVCCLSCLCPSQDQQLAALGKPCAFISYTRGKCQYYALIFGMAQFVSFLCWFKTLVQENCT